MSPEDTKNIKNCPTCGTRLSENAIRCSVCGRSFATTSETSPKKSSIVRGPKMPEMTLSLPIAIGLMLVLLAIGAGVVYAVLQGTGKVVEPTPTITPSLTPTITVTPTTTSTPTPEPTATPLPPIEYTIASGDTCNAIAFTFGVSVSSIIQLNNLPAACDTLIVGNKLLIPQPTPTPTAQPSQTLSAAEATDVACDKYEYIVLSGDTLTGIARNFNVSPDSIKSYNGLASDVVFEGMPLVIPLCERLPTPGPTPTPTTPPPYASPNLLLPADGAVFSAANDSVTLQWASVGTLRENEAYAVTIEDLTEGEGRKLTEYVTDTKFIVPSSFRPVDNVPHVLRWYIIPVRQTGTAIDGTSIYDLAGSASISRVFVWWSSGTPQTPTP
jgi:LysM repeat protein